MEPDGPVDPAVRPISVAEAERRNVVTLMAPGWRPPDDQVTQSYGFCFTDEGRVVLVAMAADRWNLPGGTIESPTSAAEAPPGSGPGYRPSHG